MSSDLHPREALHDLVSGELAESQRQRVLDHIDSCAQCRAELELLQRARALSRRFQSVELPPFTPRAQVSRRAWLAAAVLVCGALGLFWLLRDDTPLLQVAQLSRALLEDRVKVAAAEPSLEQIERRLVALGSSQPVRVIDLQMMGWSLVAADVIDQAGPRTVFIYRHTDGREIACQMWTGTLDLLPPTDSSRYERGFEFRQYQVGELVLIAWQERGQICVIAGFISADELLALAVAKAMA